MSCNVGHNCLTRLGYNAFKVSKYQSRNHTTSGGSETTRLLNSCLFPSTAQQHFRSLHSASKDEEEDQPKPDHDKSSSRFHQQYHRRAYERKRFENERTEDNRTDASASQPETSVNHYQRLNVEHTADLNTIKSAYYSLSKLYHPDVVGSDNQKASENFRLITESYDTLSDPQTRDEYDKQLNSVATRQYNPDDLAWQPNGYNSRNRQQPAFHRANADLIFRLKNELAFEQEKRKNPKKFRAGSFRQEHVDEEEAHEKIKLLDRQLNNLEHGINKDGSDFYRIHFRETLRRRREGLRSDTHRASKTYDTNVELGPLIAMMVAAVSFLYIGINTFFDIDLAADLDAKLKKMTHEDAPSD